MRWEPGQVIDGFRLIELVHKGGMARLWSVSREDDDPPLVMKVPILGEGEDPAAIVSFEAERMILPRLKGPHVPRFVADGEFNNQAYIVIERLSGPTLLPRLADLPLPAGEVAAIAASIADALESLHRQGIVHLDVKPSNVMFRPSGEAVLIDFGLSRHRDLPDLMGAEFRLPYGTAPYMAPEQVLGVRSDPRSDLFALGCLMYFFATGTRPFGDPQRLKGLKRRLWRAPAPPRALAPEVPSWLQEVILRCLEVKASRRFPTAAQLAHALRHPDQLPLTARAEKRARDSFFTALKRRSEPPEALIERPQGGEKGNADAPIVAIAVNLEDTSLDLSEALRRTAVRILDTSPGARLACINILRQSRVTIDTSLDEEGTSKHVQRLVALRDWARPMALPAQRIAYHVLEAVDPAEALLEFARVNNVDQIVMGARASSVMRKILGSVSGKVAAEAPCSVTVVRNREA